ncbi:hypothetical protein WEN_02245 [Mycoplasma wenyonii str. Massachusetts]|uniref:Uncharacterized protein n=1 Tax=Mycoplasma wenyonii (strain Massachusetts) TaxID=1197325 RepID=I6YBA0_MYCWM|nr:hypothetical protein [Mycoplasma wenyonii]AFN65236.1 hypothetical protein WEN_02245 [Mycoplasma wenyonii str. Massachusetts]
MTFLAKALMGVVGVVTSASIGTVVAYRESIFRNSQKEISDLKGRCYVIPTNSDNNQSELLICTPTDSFSSYSQYFLYKKENGGEKNELETIKKKDNKLEVSWRVREGNSVGSESNTKSEELQVNSEDWKNIKEDVNLKDDCHFVSNTDERGGKKWQCSDASVEGSSGKEFQLTPFSR